MLGSNSAAEVKSLVKTVIPRLDGQSLFVAQGYSALS